MTIKARNGLFSTSHPFDALSEPYLLHKTRVMELS